MCINEACCERFWASLCKHLCTCLFVLVGLGAILVGFGMYSSDSVENKLYAYATMGGGVVVIILGGCVKYCCADAIIDKDSGRVYQTL
jgi:hypothetical protein